VKGFNATVKGFTVVVKGFNATVKGFTIAVKGFNVTVKGFTAAAKGLRAALKSHFCVVLAILAVCAQIGGRGGRECLQHRRARLLT
jgi:hypothetical protein